MSQQVLEFKELGIGASVVLMGKDRQSLGIKEHGVIDVPPQLEPNAFTLVLSVPKESRTIVLKKDVKHDQGDYHNDLTKLSILPNCDSVIYQIPVLRIGNNVWTSWHQTNPNRLDCWGLGKNGLIDLFQIGIITHDDGKTFRLLGEYRWRGQLFYSNGHGIVGKPADQKWGSFTGGRKSIQQSSDFKDFLEKNGAMLTSWKSNPAKLDPLLEKVPGPGFARVDWYIPFAGQKGQGIAVTHNGIPVCIHGQDILNPPDADGIKRLWHNDLVRYEGKPLKWGNKKDGLPKILKVQKVR